MYELEFPKWKYLIRELVEQFAKENGKTEGIGKIANDYLDRLDEAKKNIQQLGHLAALPLILNAYSGTYESGSDVNQIKQSFQAMAKGTNEFFTIFNTKSSRFLEVDPRISELLGISPEKFTIEALIGMDPDNPLFHAKDLNHVIRWGSIAYLMLCFPLLKWVAHRDHYIVRFRIGVAASKIEAIKKLVHITVERKSYLSEPPNTNEISHPVTHFDRWCVFLESDEEYINTNFVSSPDQTLFLQKVTYMMNAHLLGIPTKDVVMLDRVDKKATHKLACESFVSYINTSQNAKFTMDEKNFSNQIRKTICRHISDAMLDWDKRKVEVINDKDCIHYARRLGILPVPESIKKLIFEKCSL